jgi:hypothetical protein
MSVGNGIIKRSTVSPETRRRIREALCYEGASEGLKELIEGALVITDEDVVKAWQAYALHHFQLRDSVPTDLERAGMRAALEAVLLG